MYNRRSIRLRDYDYTQQGAYFVTICAHEQRYLFGEITEDEMRLNAWGEIVQSCWDEIPAHYPNVELDAFMIMPNHIHGIIVITQDAQRSTVGAQYIAPLPANSTSAPLPAKHGATKNNVVPNSLGAIVRTFKAAVTRRINAAPDSPDHPVWQRNYYEHIIRSEDSLNVIRTYIVNNPSQWAADSLFIKT